MGRGRRGRGFGFGGHSLAEGSGARGRDKRRFLNQVSTAMVLSGGVAGAFIGHAVLGTTGAVIGSLVLAGLVAKFVVGGRYFR